MVRGCEIFYEAEYSVWERLEGLITTIPPNRAGRASRSHSKSLGDDPPVRAGMKWNLKMSSRGWRCPIHGIVRMNKVYLLVRSCVRAACAA